MSTSIGHKRLYMTLCRVLDSLCKEAPLTDSIYHAPPGNQDAIVQARSRALLQLFLKARFGLVDFSQREQLVTDGSQDGGIDAYYIDRKAKKFEFTIGPVACSLVAILTDLESLFLELSKSFESVLGPRISCRAKNASEQHALLPHPFLGGYRTSFVLRQCKRIICTAPTYRRQGKSKRN